MEVNQFIFIQALRTWESDERCGTVGITKEAPGKHDSLGSFIDEYIRELVLSAFATRMGAWNIVYT